MSFALAVLLLSTCTYLNEPIEDDYCTAFYETRDYILVSSASLQTRSHTIIFYPGGLVEPQAYVKIFCDFIKSNSVDVIIVKFPGNLAVFDPEAALEIKEKYGGKSIIIGGHSLGGAMACTAIDRYRDEFDGLLLMGAYPAESVDLSDWSGKVLSLSAEFDQLATADEIEASKARLPQAIVTNSVSQFPDSLERKTVFHEIKGGNHAQFGSYGAQSKDGKATITQEEQHEVVHEFLRAFLRN